jgi:hypothetical protein
VRISTTACQSDFTAFGDRPLEAEAERHNFMGRDLIPMLSLTGVILDALGGLYLAYDLLGRKKGPLRRVTKSISCGVRFATVYTPTLGGSDWPDFSFPVRSSGVEIERRNVRGTHSFLEALGYALPRAASFGAAGWLSKDAGFGIGFGILSAIGLVAAYLVRPLLAKVRR